jgi:FkbM family methyltransferase
MKILNLGGKEVAVIEGDTHISKWVEQSGRLDHDQSALPRILPHIPPGGVVVDAGAFIGDHTIAYARAVGELGEVFALEPNLEAFECLVFNMKDFPQSQCIQMGLSDHPGSYGIRSDVNAGASHLSDGDGITVTRLDDLGLEQLNFLKLDIEGFEEKALWGGARTIDACRPTMVLEVNDGALQRNGSSAEKLLDMVAALGYTYRNIYEGTPCGGPQYDIICFPKD